MHDDSGNGFVSIVENEYKGSTCKEFMEEGMPCDCNYASYADSTQTKQMLMKACGSNECINRALAVECDPQHCPCGSFCQNQRFQRRLYAQVEMRETPGKGNGLFALEDMDAGTFVIEYVGEVLDQNAFARRQVQFERENQKHFYFMTLRSSQTIDASRKGNLSRFINHSCNPNCATEKWIVNRRMCVGIFTLKPIKKGTELTFDYKCERFGNKAQACMCGEPNCQGVIGKKRAASSSSDTDSDEVEDVDEKIYFSKSTLTRLLKQARAIESPEEIFQTCKDILRAEPGGHSVFVHLQSLLLTTSSSLLRRFLHFHGLAILKNLVVPYKLYPQILQLLVQVLECLPICTRNSIEDCKIIPLLEECKDEFDDGRIEKLIEKWNSLESVYRIPKIKPTTMARSETETSELQRNLAENSSKTYYLDKSNDLYQARKVEMVGNRDKRFAYEGRRDNSRTNEYTSERNHRWYENRCENSVAQAANGFSSNGSNNSSATSSHEQNSSSLNSCLIEGVSAEELQTFMARTKSLIAQKQASTSSTAALHGITADKVAWDKYRELISVVVVKCLSKSKSSIPSDMFKKIARKLTHSLLEKEAKINPTLTLTIDHQLKEETVRMIKKYCHTQIPKILAGLAHDNNL